MNNKINKDNERATEEPMREQRETIAYTGGGGNGPGDVGTAAVCNGFVRYVFLGGGRYKPTTTAWSRS